MSSIDGSPILRRREKQNEFECIRTYLRVDRRMTETISLCTNAITMELSNRQLHQNQQPFLLHFKIRRSIDCFLGATELANQIISIWCMIDSATSIVQTTSSRFLCLFSFSLSFSLSSSVFGIFVDKKRAINSSGLCVCLSVCTCECLWIKGRKTWN